MQVQPFSLTKQIYEIKDELNEAVLRVLTSGQYIGGQEVENFEKSFSEMIGVSNTVGCNSGTDALVLALRALDIGPGDEVITCSFSFFATAEAISNVGAKPVFVDVDINTFLMDLFAVESLITDRTKAILPVHLFGHPINMDMLLELAKKYNLKVIEDCAQAAGSQWNGRPVGSWGDIGCFSFFPTKNLGAAGDGGAVTTNNNQLAARMKNLAIHGMPRRYFHTEIGYNSRLDAIQAAILNVKLTRLPMWVRRRNEIAEYYQNCLLSIPEIILPSVDSKKDFVHSWNQFVIRIVKFPSNKNISKSNIDSTLTSDNSILTDTTPRDLIKLSLMEKEINTIVYYPIPIHRQPAYQGENLNNLSLPNTDRLSKEVISLPIYPEISSEEQDYVLKALKNLFS